MASLPPTPSGVARIRHHTGAGGFQVLMGYSGSNPTSANLNTLATAARTQYFNHLAGLQSSASALNGTFCYDLANPGTPMGQDLTTVVGTRAGTQMPLQVAVILDLTIPRRYRGSKPKIFLPFGVESDGASAIAWSTTFQTAVQVAFAAYISGLTGTTFGSCTVTNQVAVSYYSGKTINPNPNSRLRFISTPRATPVVSTVSSISANLSMGSQRRRRGPV